MQLISRRSFTLLAFILFFALAFTQTIPYSAAQQSSPSHPSAASAKLPEVKNNPPTTKISPALQRQMSTSNSNFNYMVYLKAQADTSNTISPLQWTEKG